MFDGPPEMGTTERGRREGEQRRRGGRREVEQRGRGGWENREGEEGKRAEREGGNRKKSKKE